MTAEELKIDDPWLKGDHEYSEYLSHLAAEGFSVEDDLYRYFGGCVFHDGRLSDLDIRLDQRQVSFSLVNMCAFDHSPPELGIPGMSVFATRIVCTELQGFAAVNTVSVSEWEFLASSLYKRGDQCILAMSFYSPAMSFYSPDGDGFLWLSCGDVVIEDIWPRVAELFPPGTTRSVISPVIGDPETYES